MTAHWDSERCKPPLKAPPKAVARSPDSGRQLFVHSQDLVLLDRLLAELRRLLVLATPTRQDLEVALNHVEELRAAARIDGSLDLAAQLSAVAACVRAALPRPALARDPLLEAKMHLTVLRQDYAEAA